MNDGPPMDKSEGVIRFICGAVFGSMIAIFPLSNLETGIGVTVAISVTSLCGYLAYKHGDRFWYKVSDWFGMYR